MVDSPWYVVRPSVAERKPFCGRVRGLGAWYGGLSYPSCVEASPSAYWLLFPCSTSLWSWVHWCAASSLGATVRVPRYRGKFYKISVLWRTCRICRVQPHLGSQRLAFGGVSSQPFLPTSSIPAGVCTMGIELRSVKELTSVQQLPPSSEAGARPQEVEHHQRFRFETSLSVSNCKFFCSALQRATF